MWHYVEIFLYITIRGAPVGIFGRERVGLLRQYPCIMVGVLRYNWGDVENVFFACPCDHVRTPIL